MAEPRRVQLTTLSSAAELAVPSPAPLPQPAPLAPGPPADLSPADTGTVRLVLALFEPDERAFPEFSYSQLIDSKKCSEEAPLSRFEEEEKKEQDELAAIALTLEEKYGDKPKKKKDRVQDLIDIGYGYDEEDSFIDNSEAYDEFVPASITTKLGGFYVNSGVLQFRQASDTETEEPTLEESRKEPSKKRKLNSGQEKPQRNRYNDDSEMDGKLRPSSETLGENLLKKKKKKQSTLSVTSILKKFEREKELDRQRLEQGEASPRGRPLGMNTLAMGPADAGGGGCMSFSDPLLNLIRSTNGQALIQAAGAVDSDLDLDSLLDVSEDSSSSRSLPQPDGTFQTLSQTKVEGTLGQTKPEDSLSEASSGQVQQTAQSTASPEGFPPGLEERIRKLVVATKTSEGESKVKFYTPEVNSILLEIELQCRQHGGPLRSRVYSHLSTFLPCNKETLLRRVNRLMHSHTVRLTPSRCPPLSCGLLLSSVCDTVQEKPVDVDLLMKTLREAIRKAMPEQIQSWQEKCGAHEPGKITKAEEEEESEDKGGKKGKRPKKQFKWNEEIRESLRRVLKVKVERYKKKQKGQDVEEYVRTVLENELKGLWPKGWMPSRLLLKESRKLLGLPGSMPLKKSEKRQPMSDAAPSDSAALNSGQTGGSAADPDPPSDRAIPLQPAPSLSQELLAAAVAKYKQCVQKWSFSEDAGSPPLPPPPPQSSPINFPLTALSGTCHVVLPRLTLAQDTTKN